jgi:diaminohydroxyphosphoribosylaminopyrimidine deaminase/5-amino-6-(5-phosphoribosylamino)uracil reductase
MVRDNNEMMRLALETAFDHMGATSPNPAVGAVIAKEGRLVSTGGTCECGSNHAEIMAIEGARENLAGAEMFVSLEPCSHYGKTPPCVEAIIRSGIATVYLPLLDPNPLVAGRGVARLREAGVRVEFMHSLASAAADLIRPFKKSILRSRPFVVHKSALTLDGRIATEGGDSRWISSPASRSIVHRLRAKVDAVIIGKNPQAADNPLLTARIDQFRDVHGGMLARGCPVLNGRENFFLRSLIEREIACDLQPLRVLAGIPDTLARGDHMFNDDRYVIFEKRSRLDRIMADASRKRELADLRLVAIDGDDPLLFVETMLDWLQRQGALFVMLEGGGRLAGSFLDAGEIDQYLYFIAPRIAGRGIPPISGAGCGAMADALTLRDVTVTMIGDDMLFNGYREVYNFEMM